MSELLNRLISEGAAHVCAADNSRPRPGQYRNRAEMNAVVAKLGDIIAAHLSDTPHKRKGAFTTNNAKGYNPSEAIALGVALGYQGRDLEAFVQAAKEDFTSRFDHDYGAVRGSYANPQLTERMVRDELLPGALIAVRSVRGAPREEVPLPNYITPRPESKPVPKAPPVPLATAKPPLPRIAIPNTPWEFDGRSTRAEAAAALYDLRDKIRREGGVKGSAVEALGALSKKGEPIPPVKDGVGMLMDGKGASFEALMQKIATGYPPKVVAPPPVEEKVAAPVVPPVIVEKEAAPVVPPAVVEAKKQLPVVPPVVVATPRPAPEVRKPVIAEAKKDEPKKAPAPKRPAKVDHSAGVAAARAELVAAFAEDKPTLSPDAMGAERTAALSKFVDMLRRAGGHSSMQKLTAAIAAQYPEKDGKPAMSGGNLAQALGRMAYNLRDVEGGAEAPKRPSFRLEHDPEGLNYAGAVAHYAFPDDEKARARCLDFLSNEKYVPSKAQVAEPRKLEDVKPLVEKARAAFAAMKGYDKEVADAIAVQLYKDLTANYTVTQVSRLTEGGVDGASIDTGTITRWRNGRKEGDIVKPVKVDIDTVMRVADAMAANIIPQEGEGVALAKEAGAYLKGLAWHENKSNKQLLDFVLEHGHDTATFMLLARKQLCKQQHEFEKYLGIPHERYSEMIADSSKKYAARINYSEFESLVAKLDLPTPKDKARFRMMATRQPQANYDAMQDALVQAVPAMISAPVGGALPVLVREAVAMHALRSENDLADAICEAEKARGGTVADADKKTMADELRKLGGSQPMNLTREMARMVVDFAIEGAPQQLCTDLTDAIFAAQGKVQQFAVRVKPPVGGTAGGAVGGAVGGGL